MSAQPMQTGPESSIISHPSLCAPHVEQVHALSAEMTTKSDRRVCCLLVDWGKVHASYMPCVQTTTPPMTGKLLVPDQ